MERIVQQPSLYHPPFESFPGIYQCPLYMKAFPRYKRKTEKVLRIKKYEEVKKTPRQKFLTKNKGMRKVH